MPFACTKRGRFHSSEFDSKGLGVAGKSSGDPMIVPEHKLTTSNGKVILEDDSHTGVRAGTVLRSQ